MAYNYHMLGARPAGMSQNYNMLGRGQANSMMFNARPEFDMMKNPNLQGSGGANINLGAQPGTNWAGIAGMLGQQLLKSNQPQNVPPPPVPQRQWGGWETAPWMKRYMRGGR